MSEHKEPEAQVTEEVVVEFDCPQPPGDEVHRLIERSPLGTAGARAVRNRVPRGLAASVVAQFVAQQAALSAAEQPDTPVDSEVPVDAAPVAAESVHVDELTASDLEVLEKSFFARSPMEILDIEDESRELRREEILATVAASIEDLTGVSAATVTRNMEFRTDLPFDSLAAVELGTQIDDVYGIGVEIADLKHLHTVGDVVDFIEEKVWLRGHSCPVGGRQAGITRELFVGYLRGLRSCRIPRFEDADFLHLKIGNDQWIMQIRVGVALETPDKTLSEKKRSVRSVVECMRLRQFEERVRGMFHRRGADEVEEVVQMLTAFSPGMARKACAVLVEQTAEHAEWYWTVERATPRGIGVSEKPCPPGGLPPVPQGLGLPTCIEAGTHSRRYPH